MKTINKSKETQNKRLIPHQTWQQVDPSSFLSCHLSYQTSSSCYCWLLCILHLMSSPTSLQWEGSDHVHGHPDRCVLQVLPVQKQVQLVTNLGGKVVMVSRPSAVAHCFLVLHIEEVESLWKLHRHQHIKAQWSIIIHILSNVHSICKGDLL